MGTGELNAGGNPAMDLHPIQEGGGDGNTPDQISNYDWMISVGAEKN